MKTLDIIINIALVLSLIINFLCLLLLDLGIPGIICLLWLFLFLGFGLYINVLVLKDSDK
jgi:hypothetical protein